MTSFKAVVHHQEKTCTHQDMKTMKASENEETTPINAIGNSERTVSKLKILYKRKKDTQ